MEYHLVNIIILLFLLTYTHRANCSTEITDDEKAAIENGLAVGVPWQKLSKMATSQILW